MIYRSFILVWLVIVLSSFTNKSYQIDGYLNDVSPNEEWVLYRVPDDWGPDDLHIGYLKALHVPTGKDVKITSIFIEQPSTFFMDNSTVAIPVEGQVKLYDLNKNKFKKQVLMPYNKKVYEFLQFSFNEDRTKAAILLRDLESSLDYILKDSSYSKVLLKVVDFKHNKEYVVEDYAYASEESPYNIGDILWYEDQLVYSFQCKLYYYQLGNPRRLFFTNRMHAYALDGNELIYATTGEDDHYNFKRFSFADLSIKDVEFEVDPEKSRFLLSYIEPINPLQFYTARINKKNRAVLGNALTSYAYYYRQENGKFKNQHNLTLYKSKQLSICQNLDPVQLADGSYDKKTVLIIDQPN